MEKIFTRVDLRALWHDEEDKQARDAAADVARSTSLEIQLELRKIYVATTRCKTGLYFLELGDLEEKQPDIFQEGDLVECRDKEKDHWEIGTVKGFQGKGKKPLVISERHEFRQRGGIISWNSDIRKCQVTSFEMMQHGLIKEQSSFWFRARNNEKPKETLDVNAVVI